LLTINLQNIKMAAIIPPASEIRSRVKAAIDKAELARVNKIKGQVDNILSGISVLISHLEAESSMSTEYFVDNGDMNGPIEDDGLCKRGSVIEGVCKTLHDAGYFTRVTEGKFKPMGRYGTYIKISLVEFTDDEY